MNIIFGKQEADKLDSKYTVLPLDTITIKSSGPMTVYCVVESMPLDEWAKADALKKLHGNLMEEYYKRNWDFCEQAIEQLNGFWGKELDTFYEELLNRVQNFKENPPADNWNGIVAK
jgi:hypothetical protein